MICFASQFTGFDMIQVYTERYFLAGFRKNCALESLFILIPQRTHLGDIYIYIYIYIFGTCEIYPKETASTKEIAENILTILIASTAYCQTDQI